MSPEGSKLDASKYAQQQTCNLHFPDKNGRQIEKQMQRANRREPAQLIAIVEGGTSIQGLWRFRVWLS